MWPHWLRSPRRVHTRPPQSPRTKFCCSSFKDIQTLFTEDDPGSIPNSTSPKRSIFHRIRATSSAIKTWIHRPKLPTSINVQTHIVLYFTSLRVVRRTFEDCRSVRSILRGFRVPIDERDLSMDSQYIEELQSVFGSKNQNLPVVFIGGTYIGGADKIKELHESGELKRMINGFSHFCESNGGCEICGGLRFVVCEECNGSHKIYVDKHGGFKSCSTCNVNGLVRCRFCFRNQFDCTMIELSLLL